VPAKAVITVYGSPEEVEARWFSDDSRRDYLDSAETAVRFRPAPGDRGTEIQIDLHKTAPAGKLGEAVAKLTGKERQSKVKDELRRFKAEFEAGVLPRSDGVPEGELAERKLKQRPAQPLAESELAKAGV